MNSWIVFVGCGDVVAVNHWAYSQKLGACVVGLRSIQEVQPSKESVSDLVNPPAKT